MSEDNPLKIESEVLQVPNGNYGLIYLKGEVNLFNSNELDSTCERLINKAVKKGYKGIVVDFLETDTSVLDTSIVAIAIKALNEVKDKGLEMKLVMTPDQTKCFHLSKIYSQFEDYIQVFDNRPADYLYDLDFTIDENKQEEIQKDYNI
ncbi:MAG: hypothetical protein WC781_04455 [Candidatus Pacearchaeota archaeon]|jgi:anti-anti-sigma regulatory factor